MLRKLLIAVLVVAAGTAIWWFFASKSSENRAGPPLAGWMKNFTPADAAGPAPELAVLARDGRRVALAGFRGRTVLVNFWATWCAPCLREMPSLVRLQEKRGGADFTVVALSQDLKGWPVVEPFLGQHKLTALPVYVDEKTAVSRALRVSGLPTSVLLGPDGRELGRLAGHAEWDSPEALALIDHYVKGAEVPTP